MNLLEKQQKKKTHNKGFGSKNGEGSAKKCITILLKKITVGRLGQFLKKPQNKHQCFWGKSS